MNLFWWNGTTWTQLQKIVDHGTGLNQEYARVTPLDCGTLLRIAQGATECPPKNGGIYAWVGGRWVSQNEPWMYNRSDGLIEGRGRKKRTRKMKKRSRKTRRR